MLMRSLLTNFWIIRIGTLVKSVANNCVTCSRFQARPALQQMGQLPPERVQESRPFAHAGVDFAGPFNLVAFRGRGHTTRKGYLAIFVCLSSKAIHIELVSDLTAAAFIAAFKRFVARRGHCTKILSDNATNFRAADKELRTMFREASDSFKETATLLAELGTAWSFIPPSAPHFGGLWEAGVKSVKFHLRRVVGEQVLSYEELLTLTSQIEACLNSRPLYPLSDNPTDYTALTPGHLLIGEPLINIPERLYRERVDTHPLARWQHISVMRDRFWDRWSKEYLQQLQVRQKWRRTATNIKVGSLAVIKTELQPPARWLMGRVVEVHPGPDQLVRVVTLQTANGTLKRPISKVCPLPVQIDD